MACDICAKPTASPQTISEQYSTEDIVSVCDGCASMINDQIWKIRAMHNKACKKLTKSWMQNMREKLFKK